MGSALGFLGTPLAYISAAIGLVILLFIVFTGLLLIVPVNIPFDGLLKGRWRLVDREDAWIPAILLASAVPLSQSLAPIALPYMVFRALAALTRHERLAFLFFCGIII